MNAAVEEELKRIIPFIPTTPPEDALEVIHSRGYLRDERLIYSCEWVYDEIEGKKVRKVKLTCTHCGGEAYAEYVSGGCARYGATYGFIDVSGDAVNDGRTCVCPCCGKGMTAMIRPGKNYSGEINNHLFMSIHKVQGHLALLSWYFRKMVRHGGEVFYRAEMFEGAVVIGKTLCRIRGFCKYMTSVTFLDHWEYTKRFDHQFGAWNKEEVIYSDYSETDGTECEKSALVGYLKTDGALCPTQYLKIWLKHPSVENLVTAGFGDILNDVIDDATGYFTTYNLKTFEMKRVESSFDFKKVRPIDILGIDREDIWVAKSGKMKQLIFYKTIKERCGVRLNFEQLSFCKRSYLEIEELLGIIEKKRKRIGIVRILNYLMTQRDKQKEEYDKTLVDAKHLRDYWQMLIKVYRAMPDELVFPKDLRRAHDEILERIEEEENSEVNEAIAARVCELERFNYYDEGSMLFIRPAASYGEFIKEGKSLCHCVARYAKSHSTGYTNIFFIRSVDEPDKPYYTLELKLPSDREPYVAQNRGAHNCARTEEVERFEAAWLEHIKEIISKEKKNGKRNSKSRDAERIGA